MLHGWHGQRRRAVPETALSYAWRGHDERTPRGIVAGLHARIAAKSPAHAALVADFEQHPEFVAALEEYGCPEHWWITDSPVRAEWDRTWQKPEAVAS